MTWWNILKQSKLSISPKTFTAWKIPSKEVEGDCNKRLKEIGDKLNSQKGILFYLQDGETNEGSLRWGGSIGKYAEDIRVIHNPIPEDIACQVLEKMDASDYAYVNLKSEEGKWKMRWNYWRDLDVENASGDNLKFISIDLEIVRDEKRVILFSHELRMYRKFRDSFIQKKYKELDWR